MILLYKELGAASIVGVVLLVFQFPLQTYIISKMQKLSKEGLQRTDKRIGLMNEILGAMDTVKCYAWESSFQSKVQCARSEELSWFRKERYRRSSTLRYLIFAIHILHVSRKKNFQLSSISN